jgi:hypothetical protein
MDNAFRRNQADKLAPYRVILDEYSALLSSAVICSTSLCLAILGKAFSPYELCAELTAGERRWNDVSTRLVTKLNLFVLEVVKAWTNPAQKHPKTIHHHGYGKFAVDGAMIKLKSKKP